MTSEKDAFYAAMLSVSFPVVYKDDKLVRRSLSDPKYFTVSSFLNKDIYKYEKPEVRVKILKEAVELFRKKRFPSCSASFAEIMKEIADCKDESNFSALVHTDPVTRNYLQSFLFFCGRFEINSTEAPVHKSATAVVTYALDHLLYNRVYEDITLKSSETCNMGMTKDAFVEAFLLLYNRPGEDQRKVRIISPVYNKTFLIIMIYRRP